MAFTLEGEHLWNRSLDVYKQVSPDGNEYFKPYLDPSSRNQIVHRGHLLAWAKNGGAVIRSSIDLATGIKTDSLAGEHQAATFAFGAHLVEDDLFEATSVDLVAGTKEVMATRGRGCRIGNDFVVVESDRELVTSRLVSAPDGDFAKRTVLANSFQPLGDGYFAVKSCGAYADKLVFLLSTAGGEPFHAQSIIAMVTRSGELIRMFSVGHRNIDFAVSPVLYPDLTLVGGRVSRFVPFVDIWTTPDALQSRVIVADLETGTVAEGPTNELTWRLLSIRDGARWYLRFDNTISVLDGSTGKFVAAVQVPSAPLLEQLIAEYISDGKLTIPTGDERAVDAAPLVVLDASNLRVIHSNGVPVTDVSQTVRTEVFPSAGTP